MATTDPTRMTLDEWLQFKGQRTGTYTFNGVTYTDLNQVEWRQANGDWLRRDARTSA
jgi:hypothetical protein